VKAQIKSKYDNSPFRLQVNVTARGVFFDRLDATDDTKLLMVHTTPRRARLMAQWVLDNVPAQD
jgi:hypothetical protein